MRSAIAYRKPPEKERLKEPKAGFRGEKTAKFVHRGSQAGGLPNHGANCPLIEWWIRIAARFFFLCLHLRRH